MGTAKTVAGLGIVTAVAAGLFFFRDGIKNAFASDEQKAADAKKTEASASIDSSIASAIDNLSKFLTGDSKFSSLTKTDALAQFEATTDPNRDVGKFNPEGIIGFGFKNLNSGAGLKDTPENRELLALEIKTNQTEKITNIDLASSISVLEVDRATRFS